MVNAATLLAAMPASFSELVHAALADPLVSKAQLCDEYLARHCSPLGDGAGRVYVMLIRVASSSGAHWLGAAMVCDRGELEGQVIPLANWTTPQRERACQFATDMVQLAGAQSLLRQTDSTWARLYVGPHEDAEPVPS